VVFRLPPQKDTDPSKRRSRMNRYPQIVAPQIEPEIAKSVRRGHLDFRIIEP
jgi:hypothetical protein